ncbi:class I SAM-dependent methyltransferase [Niveispirillum cyanobacteriorum]|uniref:Uncharacterized protein n=1 Tax=Niveispirillum cyanobacteriorum TaxID=1612173 RepID=A0A2K9NAU7_9PROT|nr:class I SAM-dependent methyltransferase [Niveispirillum cyanobacteriorum]AUN29285.1 hypothetical protein C0V82_02775 [Niveispirillum cyanobacteriorum]GGE65628.1 hypothetical protein GCM10011317_23720 [Niveispirillum cyanobacteriorum]
MLENWADGYIADINYTNNFYGELLPHSLQFCMTLKGFEAPDANQPLRYCELGCGYGVTANMMAMAYPHITFDAVDFNPSQIVAARAAAESAGLQNIRFHERSFQEFLDESDLPEYDIISLHGIHSWVSLENRKHILSFIKKKLRSGGVVYISYNCSVGWLPLAPLRKLIQEHAEASAGGRQEQISQALALTRELIETNAHYFKHVPGAVAQIKAMDQKALGYIVHEFLGQEWHPSYFADMAEELWSVKLSFAASAYLKDHVDQVNLSNEQLSLLNKIKDPNRKESLRDIMVSQGFRRDIFVRGPRKLSVARRAQILSNYRFALTITPDSFVSNLDTLNGKAQLSLELYGPVLQRMAKGPVRLMDLIEDKSCSKFSATSLMQMLVVLVATEQASLCLPDEGYDVRRVRASAINEALFQEPGMGCNLYWASPLLGSGILTDWLNVTILGALERGIDPVDLAWTRLRDNGQRLVHESRSLRTEAENRDELARRVEQFRAGEFQRLTGLGVSTMPR